MISTVVDKQKVEEREYPYIGVLPDGELVLFYAKGSGVCIGNAKRIMGNIGEHSRVWSELNASKYDGKVILAND